VANRVKIGISSWNWKSARDGWPAPAAPLGSLPSLASESVGERRGDGTAELRIPEPPLRVFVKGRLAGCSVTRESAKLLTGRVLRDPGTAPV
jgi:hypothetical protein